MKTPPPVYYVLPVANPDKAKLTIPAWQAQGYTVMCLQDKVVFDMPPGVQVLRPWDTYAGYAKSCNWMVREQLPAACRVAVFGGDDMYPDPHKTAQQLAEEYHSRFPDGMGVMQPTGDDLKGTDKICGSPWCGRGWLDGAYGGLGPFHPGYYHFFADEEMHAVTSAAGLLWQRPDVVQRHQHWTREGIPRPAMYDHIQAKWNQDSALFVQRRAANFPGALPMRTTP